MKYPLRLVTLAVVGVCFDSCSVFLAHFMAEDCGVLALAYAPVDRPDANWFPFNAGNRVIAKFPISVAGWRFHSFFYGELAEYSRRTIKILVRD